MAFALSRRIFPSASVQWCGLCAKKRGASNRPPGFDVLGYGRLGDMQQPGRPGKVFRFADGQKSDQPLVDHSPASVNKIILLYHSVK
jgi:hypothetical protein